MNVLHTGSTSATLNSGHFLTLLSSRTGVQPGSDKNASTTATMSYGSSYDGLWCLGIWIANVVELWGEPEVLRKHEEEKTMQSMRDTKVPRRTWRHVRGAASFAEVDISIRSLSRFAVAGLWRPPPPLPPAATPLQSQPIS